MIVTLVTSLVLVPGLIASFWGAAIALPWQGQVEGTLLLLGLMIMGGASTLAFLLKVEREGLDWAQTVDYLKYDLAALRRPRAESAEADDPF